MFDQSSLLETAQSSQVEEKSNGNVKVVAVRQAHEIQLNEAVS